MSTNILSGVHLILSGLFSVFVFLYFFILFILCSYFILFQAITWKLQDCWKYGTNSEQLENVTLKSPYIWQSETMTSWNKNILVFYLFFINSTNWTMHVLVWCDPNKIKFVPLVKTSFNKLLANELLMLCWHNWSSHKNKSKIIIDINIFNGITAVFVFMKHFQLNYFNNNLLLWLTFIGKLNRAWMRC